LAKSIYSAATLPGDVYQGNAAVPQSENMVGGENTQNIDRVTNLAGLATPTAPGASITKTIPAATPTAAEAKAAGVAVYRDPAIKAIKIPPSDAAGLSAGIQNDLLEQGFRPTPESAPGTLREVSNLSPKEPPPPSFMEKLQSEMNREPLPEKPAVKNVTVDDIRSARMALGKYAGETDLKGKPTANATAATQAIGHIDDFLDNLAPSLKEANANYSRGSAAETLNFRELQARHRAAKTGSGSNIENTMRQEVDRIPNRGLSPYEQMLKNQIVEGDATRNALRKVGKVGFGDGLSLMYHVAAFPMTGGASLPLGLAATAGRKIGEGLTRNDIGQLRQAILSRSPLAQSRQPTQQAIDPKLLAAISRGQLSVPQLLRLGAYPVRADQEQ
jgi:hypothetical protein